MKLNKNQEVAQARHLLGLKPGEEKDLRKLITAYQSKKRAIPLGLRSKDRNTKTSVKLNKAYRILSYQQALSEPSVQTTAPCASQSALSRTSEVSVSSAQSACMEELWPWNRVSGLLSSYYEGMQ